MVVGVSVCACSTLPTVYSHGAPMVVGVSVRACSTLPTVYSHGAPMVVGVSVRACVRVAHCLQCNTCMPRSTAKYSYIEAMNGHEPNFQVSKQSQLEYFKQRCTDALLVIHNNTQSKINRYCCTKHSKFVGVCFSLWHHARPVLNLWPYTKNTARYYGSYFHQLQ